MADIIEFNFKNDTYRIPSKPVIFNFIGSYFEILGGRSNNFISVWADEQATRGTFKLYVASTGAGASLSVVDLYTKALVDNYTKIMAGAFNESLDAEDIADISVGSRS